MKVDLVADKDVKDRAETDADPLVKQFRGASPKQAAAWIDANVTDIATAKLVLKSMAKAIITLDRRLR